MNLNTQIIVHSTDDVTEYLGPKADIERLAQHLKVQAKIPAGLAMVSVGQDAPDQKYQSVPWLQLDESNNPLSWKFFNGSTWVEIQPLNAVAGLVSGLQIQYGTIVFNHVGNNGAWVHSQTLYSLDGAPSEFKFPTPFKTGTTVHVEVTPIFSGIHEGYTDAQYTAGTLDATAEFETYLMNIKNFEWCLGAITVTGFSLYTKTMEKILSPGKDISFRYMAIGEKA